MLNEPLAFHMKKLIDSYGHVEILHSQIEWLSKHPLFKHLTGSLENTRNAMSDILDSEKSKAIAPKKVDRPNSENQQRKSS